MRKRLVFLFGVLQLALLLTACGNQQLEANQVEYNSYIFTLPSYFDTQYKEEGVDLAYCIGDNLDKTLTFERIETVANIADYETYLPFLASSYFSYYENFDTLDTLANEKIDIDGTSGWIFLANYRLHGVEGKTGEALLYSKKTKSIILVDGVFKSSSSDPVDYLVDFENMIRNAKNR